jgi:hypothetical protein
VNVGDSGISISVTGNETPKGRSFAASHRNSAVSAKFIGPITG